VSALGITPAVYLAYEVVFNLATMFHHSNVRLPLGLERWLNKIIVTPRMHAVHHSAVGPETNSNYAVIFRWWDQMHRSLRLNIPQPDIVIGVPGYLRPTDNRFWDLLKLPLGPQRPYWRWPSGKAAWRRPGAVADPRVMLA
jgi:sterol desaturase/sphingolipid hydroxylase (fatty acid hydroxylase superfamily)